MSKEVTEIVRRAMESRRVYDEMAKQEAEFWGNALTANTTPDARRRWDAESRANQELKANRHAFNFILWALDRGMHFADVLVLGCGAGRLEQNFWPRGLFGRVHGVDISAGAVATAEEIAAQRQLPFTYEVMDLNFCELPADSYDLVIASTALHHCLHLEHIADQIRRTMRAGALLWLHDYIGESQLQYDDQRVAIVSRLIAALPEKYRYNRITDRPIKPVQKRALPLPSPFESIRSADIPGVFLERFEVVEKCEINSLIHLVAPNGVRSAYAESDEGRALFEMLMALDEVCTEADILKPTSGTYVLR